MQLPLGVQVVEPLEDLSQDGGYVHLTDGARLHLEGGGGGGGGEDRDTAFKSPPLREYPEYELTVVKKNYM